MAYAVIRNYKGASQLIDELQQRSDEVKQLIRGIPGLVHYVLVRSDDGGFSVSVYENREGAEESVRQARDYVQKNLSDVAVAPEVLQGEAVIHLTS
jgi:ABC-type Fe3+-hydroxamate transport system substrate-binding protein